MIHDGVILVIQSFIRSMKEGNFKCIKKYNTSLYCTGRIANSRLFSNIQRIYNYGNTKICMKEINDIY